VRVTEQAYSAWVADVPSLQEPLQSFVASHDEVLTRVSQRVEAVSSAVGVVCDAVVLGDEQMAAATQQLLAVASVSNQFGVGTVFDGLGV
jgi:hypothetical protein